MKLFMSEMPGYIKRELDQLQEVIGPYMKKISKYSIWTLPLLLVSAFNLIFMIFTGDINGENALAIGLFALMGAIGAALFKEVRIQQKELRKKSANYMIDRIKNSEIANDFHKKQYIQQIKNEPASKTINLFINFLIEENNRKRLLD
ncbi:YwnF family protein [Bacillus sp. FJAT-27251]|uniref:YwnF family protein n=1 Tax=Bacillus sp. FJAT-27251 TaxID=1684142 RepID=UPI0006A77AB9|nr:YwnF family protein [Bacillus sp. FJAT-27251]